MIVGMVKGTGRKPLSFQFPIEVITETINYFRTREAELTKRTIISATREMEMERIRAGRSAFEHFITAEYATRREAIAALSRMLSIAQQSGLEGQFSEILTALTALITMSPLNEHSLGLLAGPTPKVGFERTSYQDYLNDSQCGTDDEDI